MFDLFSGMTNPPYILDHLEEMAKILNHSRVYSFLHVPVQSGKLTNFLQCGSGFTESGSQAFCRTGSGLWLNPNPTGSRLLLNRNPIRIRIQSKVFTAKKSFGIKNRKKCLLKSLERKNSRRSLQPYRDRRI
jgi:hypothetical protein